MIWSTIDWCNHDNNNYVAFFLRKAQYTKNCGWNSKISKFSRHYCEKVNFVTRIHHQSWNGSFLLFHARAPKSHFPHGYRRIVYSATRGNKIILPVWSLMPEQREGNNHTSKINFYPVSHMLFFYQKVKNLICLPHTGQYNSLYDPLVGKVVFITLARFESPQVEIF